MRKYSPVLNRRRLRFAPRLLATIAAGSAVLLFVVLGNWQLGRAGEKRALYDEFSHAGPVSPLPRDAVPAPRYQRVSAEGIYDASHQFLLDNMTHAGRAGMHVLTPLLLADGSAVLVNRGWVPFGATRGSLPDIEVSRDPRAVSGRLDQLPRPLIRLEAAPPDGWPRLVGYPRMEDLAAVLGRELRPQLILLDAQAPGGYVREWRVPGTTPDRHLGYAIQWFAFAATVVAIWLAQSVRRAGEPE